MSAAAPRSALPAIGPGVVTMGVFDGVHRGHQHLVAATVRAGAERGLPSVALVFDPHPVEVLRPGTMVPRLTPPAETVLRLRRAGVEHAATLRFDDDLRRLSPEDFVASLAPALAVRALVMTPDSAFGRGRAGTPERMRELGHEVILVDPLQVDGAPVSSTRVRAAIASGDVLGASRLLGGPPLLVGTVARGGGPGRGLRYATANLDFAYAPALPALGIYTARAAAPERGLGPDHPALVMVDVRPTRHDGRAPVEVHLLGWDGDLYDSEMRVDLLDRLRDEDRFDGAEEIIAQIRVDEAEARRRLGIGPGL